MNTIQRNLYTQVTNDVDALIIESLNNLCSKMLMK